MNALKALLCKLFNHRWRRLTIAERKERAEQRGEAITSPQERICRRCGAERVAKKRKAKDKQVA